MQKEIEDLGHDVNFVGINAASASDFQTVLVNQCSFPFLQDVGGEDAFDSMGGAKDDIYVYGADGALVIYLKNGGSVNTNLSTGDGYSNVRDIILGAEAQ